jgi:hypothetical protein
MQMRRIPLLVAFVILVVTGVLVVRWAAAQQRFDQLDRNAHGKVTPDELPAAEFFKRLDGDGAITKPEAATALRKAALPAKPIA